MNIKARGTKYLYLSLYAPAVSRDAVNTLNKAKRTPQLILTQKQRSGIRSPKPQNRAVFERPSGIQDAHAGLADVLGFTEDAVRAGSTC